MPNDSEQSSTSEKKSTSASSTDDIIRSVGKSGLVLFVGTFLELGVSFVAKLVVARSLISFSYGEVAVGLTVLTTFVIVTRLGLNTGVARIAPRYEGNERKNVYLSAYLLILISTVIGGTLLYFGSGYLASFLGNEGLAPVFRIIALGIPSLPIMRVSIGIIRAEGQSGPKVIVQNITHPITRIGFVVAVALTGASPSRIVLAYIASHWSAALLALGFALRATNLSHLSKGWSLKANELLRFSLPLMFSAGMVFLIGETDNLMIQYFLNSASVGSYDIAYTLGQTLTIALGAFGFLFLPNISQLHADENWESINLLYRLVTKWIIFITFPAFLMLILFPTAIIQHTFGSPYIDGATILVIIATTYFVRATAGPNQETLSAAGKTQFILKANTITGIVNIVLNVLFIPYYGLIGAAIASFVSFCFLNILYSYQLWQLSGLVPVTKRSITPIIASTILISIVYTYSKSLINPITNPLDLLWFGTVTGIVYGVCILTLGGIEPKDIMLVNNIEDQLGIDLEPLKSLARKLL